jgi:PAS domain S-box-containing protein
MKPSAGASDHSVRHASEDRFRSIFELGLIGMAVTSPITGILEVNDELCRILGYDRSELLQTSWQVLTHPEDLAADRAQFDRVIAGEIDGYSMDKRWIRKDGRVVDSIMAARCHRRADRSVDYFVGLVQDITQRKRAESEATQQLRELTTRLIGAQEAQSKHLARELHDVFSQRLAAIGMELTRLAGDPSGQTLAGPLRTLTEQVGTLAKDIHGISRQMHPAILDDLGLPAALRSECLAFSEQYNMPVVFECDDVPSEIAEDVALCLYRVTQESLRNIGKHAGVSRVMVRLQASARALLLSVDDAGHGIDGERLKGRRGLGLVSMEERLRMVGGSLSIKSQTGGGTRVEATVPIV